MPLTFPASASGSRRYSCSPEALKEAVARALSALGWAAYGNWSGRRFVAEVGVSFWSWGEEIRVRIDTDGTVSVESACRLPTQCFDWGKNQRNVDAFLELVDEKSRQIATTGPTGQEPQEARQAGGEGENHALAIFQRDFSVRPSLAMRGRCPLPDDGDLPEQVEKAVGQALRSLPFRGRVLDRDHLIAITLRLNELAALEKGHSRYRLAEALCQRALDIFEKTVADDDHRLAEVLENYASILHATGKSQEAGVLEARAAAIRASRVEDRFFRPLGTDPDSRIQGNVPRGDESIQQG
jgi:hypothetical protein